MCKVGDIILVDNYKHGDKVLNRHSFVVLNANKDEIQGLEYDLVCNVMSSFHNEEHKRKKMTYPGNYVVNPDDVDIPEGNNREGYIKAEQFYYFKRDSIDYMIIGTVDPEFFAELVSFIEKLDIDIVHIVDNLQ